MKPDEFEWCVNARPTVHIPFTFIGKGSRIPVLPVSDRLAGCGACVRRDPHRGKAFDCRDFPVCGGSEGVTFMEDTPENRARYSAALVTGKPMNNDIPHRLEEPDEAPR